MMVQYPTHFSNPLCSAGIGTSYLQSLSLPQDYLNVRGHVSANVGHSYVAGPS